MSFWKAEKKPKYNNKRSTCRNNHNHRSIFESDVCNQLFYEYSDLILKKEVEIEVEKKFEFIVEGVRICFHYMDFFISFRDGRKLAIEAKGFQTDSWKLKKALFKALFPKIEYKVIFKKKT